MMRNLFLSISAFVILFLILTSFAIPAFANDSDSEITSDMMVGIDVSLYNGTIDWARVKAAGVQFAMLRICSHTPDTPNYTVDANFASNIAGAKAQGIHIGAYFFSYAKTADDVINEANMVVDILNEYPETFSFPIVFDAEEGDVADGFDITPFAAQACQNFCDVLGDNGYYAMVYANTNWFNNIIKPESMVSEYDLWQANYYNAYAGYTPLQALSVASLRPHINNNDDNVKMWQLTNQGSVDGISGDVDLNIAYLNYSKIIPPGGYNLYPVGTHIHDYRPSYDQEQHYKKCECGEIDASTPELHSLFEITNDQGHYQACECGFERIVSPHAFNKFEYDEAKHWKECSCGYIVEEGSHILVDNRCMVCNLHDHVFEAVSEYNEEGHWNKCNFCEMTEENDHIMVACACTECDYATHTFVMKSDCEVHWVYCENCDLEYEKEAHEIEGSGICIKCNERSHVYETRNDNNGHWLECNTCHSKKDEGVHTLVGGACECGYEVSTISTDDEKDAEGCKGTLALSATELFLTLAFCSGTAWVRKKDK